MSKAKKLDPDALAGKQWLSPKEVEFLGVAAWSTLRNWRSAGYGPPYAYFGGRVRYERAALDRWAAQRRIDPRG